MEPDTIVLGKSLMFWMLRNRSIGIARTVSSLSRERPLSSGSTAHKAMVYDVKVQIGGMAGLLERVIGKQPPDSHVWVLGGEAPAFVKYEGSLYEGGPIWRIEPAKPASFP